MKCDFLIPSWLICTLGQNLFACLNRQLGLGLYWVDWVYSCWESSQMRCRRRFCSQNCPKRRCSLCLLLNWWGLWLHMRRALGLALNICINFWWLSCYLLWRRCRFQFIFHLSVRSHQTWSVQELLQRVLINLFLMQVGWVCDFREYKRSRISGKNLFLRLLHRWVCLLLFMNDNRLWL